MDDRFGVTVVAVDGVVDRLVQFDAVIIAVTLRCVQTREIALGPESDDVSISFLEAGQGEPLLLVHGFTGAKEDFADEVDRLAGLGHHVVAPDLRGHGDSSQPADEAAYSVERFAADLWALTDHLGWPAFDLLGHSMGGMIAQVMVLDRPASIERLVLMDTHHGRLGTIDPELVRIGIELARTQGLEVIQQVLKMGADPLDNPAYRRVCAERAGYEEWSESKMLRSSPAMYASMLGYLDSVEDRLAALAGVAQPTLVMVGELDEGFLGASRRMADAIPGAELVVLDGGGHSPQFEATAAWRDALDRFLATRR